MESSSCVISPITTVGPSCAGHGQCLPLDNTSGLFACECEDGWFGGSDFQVTSSLTDCHIPTTAIVVFWAIYLVVHVVVGLTYIPRLRHLFNKHQSMADSARTKGRVYTVFHNKPLVSLVPYFLVGYPMQFAFAVYKLANIRTYLAQDAVLTATYIVWRFTFFFATSMLQSNFLASLLTNERKMQHVIRKNFFVARLHFVCMQLLSVCIVLPMVLPQSIFNPVVGMANVSVFLLCTSVGMLLIALHASYVKSQVLSILAKSFAITHDVRTRKLSDRFTKFQTHNMRTAYSQFGIYGVFGAFPYMWNKHEWLVPVAWIAVVVTFKQALDSLIENMDDQPGSSTIPATDKKTSALVSDLARPAAASVIESGAI
ncbi:hypothetical protein BASA81_016241 [Batrachochytrium salamandrivorans]|nr:hypothetical protein BASA81_016241 [Batrachochytrium salamandrivorans]